MTVMCTFSGQRRGPSRHQLGTRVGVAEGGGSEGKKGRRRLISERLDFIEADQWKNEKLL